MPVFVEDPVHLSKSRLKSDLVAHNVELPPAKSKKEVYVELHLKHIDQRQNAADFSSDEEEQVQVVADKEENLEDATLLNLSGLTDDDLKAALLKYGFKAGPIVASTRILYEKKLRKLVQSDGHNIANGSENALLYSDSEEEEETGNEEDADTASEDEKQEEVGQSDQEGSNQNGDFAYQQCFLPSSRLRTLASRNRESSPKRNSRNALKSSERGRSRCSPTPTGIGRPSSVGQQSGLGSGLSSGSQLVMVKTPSPQAFSITQMVEEMESRRSLSASSNSEKGLNGSNVQEHWSRSNRLDMPSVNNRSVYYTPKASPHQRAMKPPQEPAKDIFKDMFPDAVKTPTGIYASCRKPIKGAARRPIQYPYPDTPVSPTTMERREVERRLVPIHIQILVFLTLACVLYLIYVCVEDNSFTPFVTLLDSISQWFDSESLWFQTEAQDTAALSGQE